jgi:hypothetical protein
MALVGHVFDDVDRLAAKQSIVFDDKGREHSGRRSTNTASSIVSDLVAGQVEAGERGEAR